MLEALRRGANSWVLKPLLLLLVLAFVVWGVADVFTGVRTSSLASVGASEISVEEYQATYSSVMNNIARRFGRRPTAEEAKLRGIDRGVLDELINAASIDQQVRGLGLALPQSVVVKAIESDPGLQGPDGKLDRAVFQNFLREVGYNERGYLNLRRREELRQQLTQSLFQDMPVAPALATLVHNWREATRTIQHFTIDPEKQAKVAEPDEAQLKEVYSAQQREFVTPEYRHIGVLLLAATDVKRELDISEDDLRKTYEQDKGAREVQERRNIQQIPFKDKAAAETAAKAIAAGRSFVDVAKEAGATEKDIELGTVERAALIDPAIAAAAFALAKGQVSAPVTGRFTTVLLRVTEIEAAKVKSFEDMRQEVRDKLAEARANQAIRKLHDSVDDGRAAGKPLKEIAEALKIKYVDLAQVDRIGRKPDGNMGYDGTDAAQILRAGFEGKPGVEIEPIDLADGGYGWVDALGITPERQRPFEDVKDDVKKVWQRLETQRQVSDLAGKLMERGGKGETMTALAKDVGGKLETSKAFRRFGTESGLPPVVVQRAFAIALGGRASVESDQDGKRMVFRLVEVTKPVPPTKEQLDQLIAQLRTELQQDSLQAYVQTLRERFGVNVNETLFRRTTGESSDQK